MRVFVTGIGAVSAFGNSWEEMRAKFLEGKNAVRYMSEWESYKELNTRLAAPIIDYKHPQEWDRKQLRSGWTCIKRCWFAKWRRVAGCKFRPKRARR